MHLVDQQLTVFNAAPGVLQVQCAGADGFDLSAHQFDAGFVFFFDKVFVPSLSVGGHDFDAILFQMRHLVSLAIIPRLSSHSNRNFSNSSTE